MDTNIQVAIITISCLGIVFTLVYSLYQKGSRKKKLERKRQRMNRVVKSGKKKGWVTEEEMKVMEDIFNQPSKN